MSRTLFFGPDAIDSVIPLVHATDSKLMTMASSRTIKAFNDYSPWMAIPKGMLQTDLDTNWVPKNRFFEEQDLSSIQNIFKCINIENDLIPSHEEYQLKISTLQSNDIDHFNSRIMEAETQLMRILPHFELLISR